MYDPFLETSAGTTLSIGVDMMLYVTGGAGTAASPYTGWESITAAANTTYLFGPGTWQFTTWPASFANHGVRIIGASGYGTIFKHIGTGNGVSFAPAANIRGLELSHFHIVGTALTTNALYLKKVLSSVINDVRSGDCTAAGMLLEACIGNTLIKPRVSSNEPGGFTVQPAEGIVFEGVGAVPSTTNDVLGGMFEGVSGSGIHLKQCHDIRFYGGVSEGNNRGLEIDALSGSFPSHNHFHMNFEGNVTEDALVKSIKNTFVGITSTSTFRFSTSSANDNVFIGGALWNLTIDAGAIRNAFFGVNISNVLTDNGTDTYFQKVFMEQTAVYFPNTTPGRVVAVGIAPAVSGATGLDTGSAAIVATSTDHVGYVTLFPAGTPLSTGEVVVTFNTPLIGNDPPVILPTLVNGSPGTWDTKATVTIQAAGLSSFKLVWDNNGVALTAPGATYRIGYQVVGIK